MLPGCTSNSRAARLQADGVESDPSSGGGPMVFRAGMRIRLTQNIHKDRGFVNGWGIKEQVLSKACFVLRANTSGVILSYETEFCGCRVVTAMPPQ